MARGGLSYGGFGFQAATFKAGAGIKALVEANDRDYVVGMPVTISGAATVDLGNDGDTPFGFIDIYETDERCSIQYRGFREGVPTISATAGSIVATDGTGNATDSSETAKLRSPIFVEVDSEEKTATVFLG